MSRETPIYRRRLVSLGLRLASEVAGGGLVGLILPTAGSDSASRQSVVELNP